MPGFNASLSNYHPLTIGVCQLTNSLTDELVVGAYLFIYVHVYKCGFRYFQTEEGVKVRDLCKCMRKLSDSLSMIYLVKLTLSCSARLDIPKSALVKSLTALILFLVFLNLTFEKFRYRQGLNTTFRTDFRTLFFFLPLSIANFLKILKKPSVF